MGVICKGGIRGGGGGERPGRACQHCDLSIDALAVKCSLHSSVRRFKSFKDMAISDHRS